MNLRLDLAQKNAARLERAIFRLYLRTEGLSPLKRSVLVQPLVSELHAVRERIDAHLSLISLSARADGSVLILSGEGLGANYAPMEVLGSAFCSLQKAVRQVGHFLAFGVPAARRIRAELTRESELSVLAVKPGSLRIEFAAANELLFDRFEAGLANESLGKLARCLAWASSASAFADFSEIVPHPVVRRQIACRIRELAPTASTRINRTTLDGHCLTVANLAAPVVLTRLAGQHASAYLQDTRNMEVDLIGQLVELDWERSMLELKVDGTRIRCEFSDRLLGRAKSLIGSVVRVIGLGNFQDESELPSSIEVQNLIDDPSDEG